MSRRALSFSLIMFLAASCGTSPYETASSIKEGWNPDNDPNNISTTWERKLTSLPVNGGTSTPWTDSYWPSNRAGVAQRWQTSGSNNFTYGTYSKAQLQTMTSAQIGKLSPAEKFDILRGNYNYPVVAFERGRTSPSNASWEGICHGWAAASLAFKEPKPVNVTNAHGISIPFGSADIKAMLSHYTAMYSPTGPKAVGVRCFEDINGGSSGSACKDVNAGAFHLAITNKLGLEQTGVVVDVTTSSEVWNQPVYKYSSQILGYQNPSNTAAPGTVREARIKTTIWYTVEISPKWEKVGEAATPVQSREYTYRVELNAADEIIGGEWTGGGWPDVLWIQNHGNFLTSYAKLNSLYEASVQ
jgi:hypothetical protein